MLLVVLGVAFVYCGGSNVPAVLRNNKQLLGGVVVGLFLCSFFNMRLEGVENDGGVEEDCNERINKFGAEAQKLIPKLEEINISDECLARRFTDHPEHFEPICQLLCPRTDTSRNIAEKESISEEEKEEEKKKVTAAKKAQAEKEAAAKKAEEEKAAAAAKKAEEEKAAAAVAYHNSSLWERITWWW